MRMACDVTPDFKQRANLRINSNNKNSSLVNKQFTLTVSSTVLFPVRRRPSLSGLGGESGYSTEYTISLSLCTLSYGVACLRVQDRFDIHCCTTPMARESTFAPGEPQRPSSEATPVGISHHTSNTAARRYHYCWARFHGQLGHKRLKTR